jgi:four helix bundle protein
MSKFVKVINLAGMENNHVHYTDLDVWKSARQLANLIYTVTKSFPTEERYGLTSQMRRAAVSIPSNIAEGCGRGHSKDALNFFFMARGSLFELETQLFISSDQGFIENSAHANTMAQIESVRQVLGGFIRHRSSRIS